MPLELHFNTFYIVTYCIRDVAPDFRRCGSGWHGPSHGKNSTEEPSVLGAFDEEGASFWNIRKIQRRFRRLLDLLEIFVQMGRTISLFLDDKGKLGDKVSRCVSTKTASMCETSSRTYVARDALLPVISPTVYHEPVIRFVINHMVQSPQKVDSVT